jgi:hypothetical protein
LNFATKKEHVPNVFKSFEAHHRNRLIECRRNKQQKNLGAAKCGFVDYGSSKMPTFHPEKGRHAND